MDPRTVRLISGLAVFMMIICVTSVGLSLDDTDGVTWSETADVNAGSHSAKVGETKTIDISSSFTDPQTKTHYYKAYSIKSNNLPSWATLSVTGVNSSGCDLADITFAIKLAPTATASSSDYKFTIELTGKQGAMADVRTTFNVTVNLTALSAGTPVTSVSISGSTSVNMGSTITLTATTGPTNATDRGVTWSITSGGSYATISSQSSTSTGGTCVLKGVSEGSVTIKATANDGSGKSATKTITVKDPTVYVTSISISGSSTIDIGDTATFTATTSPSSATDRHVTWTITSGSSRVSIMSETDTSTGGRIVLEGLSEGSVTIKATANDGSGKSATKTITIELPEYYYYLKYDANGGTGAPSNQSQVANDTESNLRFTISSQEPTRTGYTFLGWATSSGATTAQYKPGASVYVDYNDLTLYAVWKQSTINFTSSQGNVTITTGMQFMYSPSTNVSGCTFSVSGADWLSVSGGTISGTPASTGTFTVNVTASASGYSPATQTFTITVISQLIPTNGPQNGVTVYVLE